MEELDRELRLAQDACQRLKSQVSVYLCVMKRISSQKLTFNILLGVEISSAIPYKLLLKFLKAFLFMFYYFIFIFFVYFLFNETKTLLTIFLSSAAQINSRNWLKF